jgi:M6 family metalloprotease-like protein
VTAALAGVGVSSPDGAGSRACLPALTVPGVTEGRSEHGTVAPSIGVLRAALLLVHAADAPPDDSVAVAPETFDASEAWFRAVSFGRLELRVEMTPRWLPLPRRSAEYVADGERYLRDAVAAADPHIDFSRIDVVYLSPSSRTPATATSAILNGFGTRADGKEVRFWIPFGAGFAAEASEPYLLVHETGHLLGLPDLYSRGAPSTFHRWDVMAARWPAELFAWHRWKLGWLEPGQVVCMAGRPATRTVTLAPVERPGGTKAVFVKRGGRILAVEVRAREGYDRTLCETGVLVYEVDQTQFKRTPVHLYEAQTGRNPPEGTCGARWNAPFDSAQGEVRTLRLTGVRVAVLARRPDGSYRVRVVTAR